jgi:hypothetical protein
MLQPVLMFEHFLTPKYAEPTVHCVWFCHRAPDGAHHAFVAPCVLPDSFTDPIHNLPLGKSKEIFGLLCFTIHVRFYFVIFIVKYVDN